MTAAMKPWQCGYSLDEINAIKERFAAFNAQSVSPFSEMNGPRIAEGLRSRSLQIFDWGCVDVTFPRVETPIKACLDVVIAHKKPGDRVVNAFCYDEDTFAGGVSARSQLTEYLASFHEPTYLWIWQENPDERAIARNAGYEFVGGKITSFAEIRGLWFKDGEQNDLFSFFGNNKRTHPFVDPTEFLGLRQADLYTDTLVDAAIAEVQALDMDYTRHYSNYQDKKSSWSALSLRGYTADPAFIIKPGEMRRKWHEKNPGPFAMQDTPLRAQLPAVDALHKRLTDRATSVHRIRLMKLAPGGGELKRHTDLTDKDSGIADGCVARFHFPIITNRQVIFGSWDMRGVKHEVNMRVGECWYLDTRKPHQASNLGKTDRIHLVVDVESNSRVRGLLQGE
jgi:hypothetical protein